MVGWLASYALLSILDEDIAGGFLFEADALQVVDGALRLMGVGRVRCDACCRIVIWCAKHV